MHAPGTFFDARLNDKDQYPVAAKSGAGKRAQYTGQIDVETGRALDLERGHASIRTPGLSMPSGSDSRLAARNNVFRALAS